MAKTDNKRPSINSFFRLVNIFPFLALLVIFAGAAIFSILYVSTNEMLYIYLLIGYATISLIVFMVGAVHFSRRFNALFVRGLYSITVFNLRNIADNENTLIDYPNNHYEEFVSLNKQVENLKSELDNATLIAANTDFSHINLDYIDVSRRVVSLKSFKDNLEEIIFASQNYRNVLIELFYELNDDTLSEQDIEYLITLLYKNFGDYRQLLIIVSDDKRSLLMYFPRIDSLSKIRELLESTLKSATINKHTPEGITNLIAHFALVCYPFSDVKELFPDLTYAKRQGEIINIYLPNRFANFKDNKILKNSMNLNAMSKILTPLLNLNLSLENSSKNRQEVEKVLRTIRTTFDIDYTGIISYDEVRGAYYFSYQNQNKELPVLSKDNYIEKEFVYAMNSAKDENNSYYFAYRSHANSALGRHLDRVGLESGLFYVLNEGDVTVGAIYFFNKNKELHIDSYIQESLVVLCDKIATILLGERRDEEVNNSYQEIESLLKLSEVATYRVSNSDYTLLRTSRTLHDIFPRATLREKCYKTLYGLDKPCRDCPLLTGNKKVTALSNTHYETSLVLASRKSAYRIMTLRNIGKEEGEQRYHPDLLINSYSSLVEALTNSYMINGKGYLLLLRNDNLNELIERFGPEGYLNILREFINKLKKRHNALENIYYFNNQTLALLFTEYGQVDIINECEEIYAISQHQDSKENMDYVLNFTYLPIGYPRAYPTAQTVLKQAEQFANRGKYQLNRNYIYFDDSSYQRSACKEDFMLSVIDSAFGNKTFQVLLQPMIEAKTRHIYGAELLLRITDEYRNMTFRADELATVAAEHNKIGLISNALLEYTGALYQQYNASVFSLLGFKRLSINTDYSFFTDEKFYGDTAIFMSNLRLPKNFLAFEIPESDVANHAQELKAIFSQINSLHIVLVCDQYTGRFVSLEALKDIGFNEVKISRNFVNHIDSDRQRQIDVRNLINNVKELGLKTSVVGVENIDQYHILRDIDDTALLQGFYFHRPLEKQDLIEAVRNDNRAKKDE